MTKKTNQNIPKKIILWGGTGQAKLVRPIIEKFGGRVIAVFDHTPDLKPPFEDVPIYVGEEGLAQWIKGKDTAKFGFCVAIGNPNGEARIVLAKKLYGLGFVPINVIHPSAIIADDAVLGKGCQILAGAVLGPEVTMGQQCIINANASVDHECVLSDAVEVGPGATLCGAIEVGFCSWIGAGATILPRVKIGRNVIVGAGAVVTKDIPDNVTSVGVPARPIAKKGD